MRTNGKITHWNADKGYGFITPGSGAKQVFVHISAFSDRSLQPRLDELVTFTLSTDKQGRPCALQVTRAGEKPQRVARFRDRRDHTRSPVGRVALVVFAVVLAGSYAFSKYQQVSGRTIAPASTPSILYQDAPTQFQCDGRTHCSQIDRKSVV